MIFSIVNVTNRPGVETTIDRICLVLCLLGANGLSTPSIGPRGTARCGSIKPAPSDISFLFTLFLFLFLHLPSLLHTMSYYGGDPYSRPPPGPPQPYGAPPYQQPPYGQPPQQPPYQQQPYDQQGYDRPSYDRAPYSAPPPQARPPPGPPPPLPQGWHQEWEPSARRAFWVEQSTGRSEWELRSQAQGSGYYDGSRSVPPPASQGGYYPPPGPPPPQPGYDNRSPGPYAPYPPPGEPVPEKKSSNAGKYLAAGAAGLALGGIGAAIYEHESEFLFPG